MDATLNSVWYVVQWCDKMSLYVGSGHGFVSVFCITVIPRLMKMICSRITFVSRNVISRRFL